MGRKTLGNVAAGRLSGICAMKEVTLSFLPVSGLLVSVISSRSTHIFALFVYLFLKLGNWQINVIVGIHGNHLHWAQLFCTVPKHDCQSSPVPWWPALSLLWLQLGLSMVACKSIQPPWIFSTFWPTQSGAYLWSGRKMIHDFQTFKKKQKKNRKVWCTKISIPFTLIRLIKFSATNCLQKSPD